MEEPTKEVQGTERTPQELMMENMRIMNSIVREMKEIPELPSESPKDVSALLKVEFPPTGGILTHMEGHEFPYKGFPYFEFVDKIDFIKKVSRAILSGLYHALKGKSRLWLVTLLPAAWVLKVAVRVLVYVFYRMVERFRIKPHLYSDAIRELYRAFTADRECERIKTKEFRLQIRDLLCMILEFDNAYRFRFQDLSEELNKESAKKDITKELLRLFSIMQTRENHEDVKNTWVLFKLFVKAYLWLDKEMQNILADVISHLDVEKVKLSVEDRHYCKARQDYTFAFMGKVEK